jgi:hypothetical protein
VKKWSKANGATENICLSKGFSFSFFDVDQFCRLFDKKEASFIELHDGIYWQDSLVL